MAARLQTTIAGSLPKPSWLAEPVAVQLEAEFGKPVLCNQAAVIRNVLKLLGAWTPMTGHSRVLATV